MGVLFFLRGAAVVALEGAEEADEEAVKVVVVEDVEGIDEGAVGVAVVLKQRRGLAKREHPLSKPQK
jgi:hypothetical protein